MTSTDSSTSQGFRAEERAAVEEHARELRTEALRTSRADEAAQEARDVLADIAGMSDPDRYGMPAHALDGSVVCYFHSAETFTARYAILGFDDRARLDDEPMGATSSGPTEVTAEVEERIAALVARAVG
ncbi:hypothetical protein SAMN05660359_04372 [Geodermatophilus obscurus]|uniref:YdhG-like domain-containing protein n=1 Tax=Geodermatophilus obscurus TaxID=1861 RepID=A0A1I5I7A2_9ACTN|nr:hypothetical protein [Geodermatophilus obscurus]SFO56538.1 hypothetical protein SAMN05660359_04372 [Geodermatophilus obscurus]